MTRVVITSDLHLGITDEREIMPMVDAITAETPDLTVIAGDIGEGLSNIVRCLSLFHHLPGRVAALAGNHDVWSRDGLRSDVLWEYVLPETVRQAGMLWLEEECWRQDGLAVAGSIAWYDYSAADPSIGGGAMMPEPYWATMKRRLNNDADFINWRWSDVAFAAGCGEKLVERVAALDADGQVSDTLVVTHVPLFEEQMLRKPDDRVWSMGNAYFGNLTLGARLRNTAKLCAVVSGHTHVGRQSALPSDRALPVWVVASQYHAPRYVVYEHPDAVLREQV